MGSALLLLLQELIPTSLLKLNTDNAARAVKMFATIQRYMGETGEALTPQQRLETIQKLLHQVSCQVSHNGERFPTIGPAHGSHRTRTVDALHPI